MKLLWWKSESRHSLPLILSPVLTRDDIASGALPRIVKTTTTISQQEVQDDETLAPSEATTFEHVTFQRYNGTTRSELFYDLFFVANLSTFTAAHSINTGLALESYCGFFGILWFTWLQVSIYDLRFYRDSVFDRLCKLLQFGVMVAFILVGREFDPHGGTVDGHFMSLALMASRLCLAVQYTIALAFLWKVKAARAALITTASLYLASAMAYLGLSYAFPPEGHASYAYIAWYVIALAETAMIIATSMHWRILSFKHTHIEERFSLLTLIILGEGLLGLGEALVIVAGQKDHWATSAFIGDVVAGIVVLYCLYMLYFDSLPHTHMGTLRQQIWAALHFPFHVALVLNVEGLTQSILWQGATEAVSELTTSLEHIKLCEMVFSNHSLPKIVSAARELDYWAHSAAEMSELATHTVEQYWSAEIEPHIIEHLHNLTEVIAHSGNETFDHVSTTVFDFANHLYDAVYASFEIEVAATATSIDKTDFDTISSYLEGYSDFFFFVFVYFFVSCAFNIIMQGLLRCLSLPRGKRTSKKELCKLGLYLLAGTTEALMSLLIFSPSLTSFTDSPWLIVTVALITLILVVVANL